MPKPYKISESNNKKLKEHSKKFSTKHINMMKKLMKDGKSFSVAHKEALKKVGK